MKAAIITPNNLKAIGFKEINYNDEISYERDGIKIYFGEVAGIDCIAGTPHDIPVNRLLREIQEKLSNRL